MTEVYLLQNENGYFLNNQQEWVDGREANRLYKTIHKDEAINTKVELTVKSADIRIRIIECAVNDRGIPQIPAELLPEIMPAAKESCAPEASDSLEHEVYRQQSDEGQPTNAEATKNQ